MRPLVVALLLIAVAAGRAPARDVGGATLAETATAGGTELQLNGAGIRTRALVVRVYAIGLYLPRRTQSAEEVLRVDGPRRVELHMLRALDGAQIGGAIREAFERNSGDALPRLESRLDRLTHLFPAVRPGDVIALTWVPGEGTVVTANGKRLGVIEGEDFAAALLAVWLGPRPVEDSLKRALLAGAGTDRPSP